jgi:hypothetical protein
MTDDTAAGDVTEEREPLSPPPVYRHDMTPGAYRATRRLGWVLGAVFTVLLLAVSANLYLTLNRTVSACDFWRDLSGLPVTNAAGTNKPSELGVSIIAHSRQAFRGSGCPGALPPPSPSFRHWAPYYHLPPE